MLYPTHLIPQPNYLSITTDKLPANCFLIRHTSIKDILDPATQTLRADCIVHRTDHLKDLSTNLLGCFTPADGELEILKNSPSYDYFQSLWDVGGRVIEIPNSTDFTVRSERGFFYLKIEDFNNQRFEYVSDNEKFIAICKVLHTPINCNYWHCSLRWIDADGNDVMELPKEKQRRKVLTAAKSLIINNAIIGHPEHTIISERLYQSSM